MRFAILIFVAITVIVSTGCARETLPLELVDERDAEPSVPDSDSGVFTELDVHGNDNDAGDTPIDAPANCPDEDGDTVCDGIDNCPTIPNTDQADGDQDGVGDACLEDTEVVCNPEAVAARVTADEAVLSNVRVNGAAGVASVGPGATLEVSLEFSFGACSITDAVQLRLLVLGYDEDSEGTCSTLVATPCPLPVQGSANMITLRAPSARGLHYIIARGTLGFTCLSSSSLLAGAQRIAAICVR